MSTGPLGSGGQEAPNWMAHGGECGFPRLQRSVQRGSGPCPEEAHTERQRRREGGEAMMRPFISRSGLTEWLHWSWLCVRLCTDWYRGSYGGRQVLHDAVPLQVAGSCSRRDHHRRSEHIWDRPARPEVQAHHHSTGMQHVHTQHMTRTKIIVYHILKNLPHFFFNLRLLLVLVKGLLVFFLPFGHIQASCYLPFFCLYAKLSQ